MFSSSSKVIMSLVITYLLRSYGLPKEDEPFYMIHLCHTPKQILPFFMSIKLEFWGLIMFLKLVISCFCVHTSDVDKTTKFKTKTRPRPETTRPRPIKTKTKTVADKTYIKTQIISPAMAIYRWQTGNCTLK